MRISREECPVCGGGLCDGELQENGDNLVGKYECPDCDTEFEITWEKFDTNILYRGTPEEEEEEEENEE